MQGTFFDILLLAAGLILLGWGGDVLVRGAVTIAYRCGISALIVGLTVVAFGTSAPELAFNVIAAFKGDGELVYGNIVGSNICNVGLILGVAAFLKPLTVHAGLIRREVPIMVGAMVIMAVIAYTPPHVEGENGFARPEGLALLVLLLVYTWGTIAIALRERAGMATYTGAVEEVSGADRQRSLPRAWLLFIGGLAVLTIGGVLGREGAVGIALSLGVPSEIVGLTIVAIGTSLPELATALVAIRKGQVDMAVGNIVGSNIFNVFFVFGMSAAVSPVPVPPGALESLGVMVGFAMMLLVMSRTRSGRVSRIEGGLLLTVYALYLAHQCWLALQASGNAPGA